MSDAMDIVERLRFDSARCEMQFSKGVAGNIEEAAAEIARLREQLSHAVPAIEELTKEREEYRTRWLGSVTPEEGARLRTEIERLLAALKPFAELAGKLDGAPNLIGLLTEADFQRAASAYNGED